MEWKISKQPVPYEEAVHFMEARVEQIRAGTAPELVWLLTHPALYTAGTSARDSDLVDTLGFPVYKTGRGGQYTYHGPGQRVAYVMLDLKKRTPDVRLFVKNLEQWVIETLAALGVKGETREGRVGVWVDTRHEERGTRQAGQNLTRVRGGVLHDDPAGEVLRSETGGSVPPIISQEAKIAALGVRLKHWVSYHGISINVNPDLSHYRGIVPCGISEYGVTSLATLGIKAGMKDVDAQLQKSFAKVFY